MGAIENADNTKSKNRVDSFGEVFTPQSLVNDMLDMLGGLSYDMNATYLEPTCGTGNFLVEILNRKLKTAQQYKGSEDYLLVVFRCVASIYGVEILPDNARTSRKRLHDIVQAEVGDNKQFMSVIDHVLDTNIILGDTREGVLLEEGFQRVRGGTGIAATKTDNAIVITEWNIAGDMVTPKQYPLNNLDLCIATLPTVHFMELADKASDGHDEFDGLI